VLGAGRERRPALGVSLSQKTRQAAAAFVEDLVSTILFGLVVTRGKHHPLPDAALHGPLAVPLELL
jgi:hypothetical protein